MRKEKAKAVVSEQDTADALNRVLEVGKLLASVFQPEELAARFQPTPGPSEQRPRRNAQLTNKRQND